LIIHPTYFDTHALSLLEGIALGTPFIATATFAIQEYKNREPNGILINNPFLPYDSKALPNFKGKALDYAKNVSEHEKVNECMILEICNSMSKIFDNYSFFKYNAMNINVKFTDDYIIDKWLKVLEIFHKNAIHDSDYNAEL